MSFPTPLHAACLRHIRRVEGIDQVIRGDTAGSLTAFLEKFDNGFCAFVATLDVKSIGYKYLVGMIIYQLVFFPWSEDYSDDIQYSFNARLWRRYESCESDLGLSEVDKKLLRNAGVRDVADKQVFVTEIHFRHPLRRRHPISECHTSIKKLFQDLGITKIEARNKYFGALGRWDREQLENAGWRVVGEVPVTLPSGEVLSTFGESFTRPGSDGTMTAETVHSLTTGDRISSSTYRPVWEETSPDFRLEPL